MKKIGLIRDEDFGLESKKMTNPMIRYASRGIVLYDNKIAVLNKKNKNEYKLIGGGREDDEPFTSTFIREVREEAGAELDLNSIKLIGTIEENRSLDNFKQISYVYVANVNTIGNTFYTKKEKDEGATVIWVGLDEAKRLIKECENNLLPSKYESIYHTKFIVRRDYEILNFYQKTLEKKD